MAARRDQAVGVKGRNGKRVVALSRRETDNGNGASAVADDELPPGPNGGSNGGSWISQAAGNDGLSGVTLLHQAMAVAAAADAYSARGRTNISALTLQFLLGRSLELALKAYLIYKDCGEDRLSQFGQDLSKLLEQATAHSFELHSGTSDADRRAVAVLSANYIRKMIEYPRAAGNQLIASRVLREIVHRAIAAVFVAIWNEDPLEFNLRRASDRALGLCIADDACYDEFPAAIR